LKRFTSNLGYLMVGYPITVRLPKT
jgi:hypothetical protein